MYVSRKKFFASVKTGLFPKLGQGQVDGMERWLSYWESKPNDFTDVRWLAYILATNYWETGRKMVPVVEIGKGKSRAYGKLHAPTHSGSDKHVPNGLVYYGRGDPQLTWYDNYLRMQELTGWPLVDKPDAMLDPKISAEVTIEGMTRGKSLRGDFTGKSLNDYFSATVNDPVNARRIINGTDQAKKIADIYQHFLHALMLATTNQEPVPPVISVPDPAEQDAVVKVKEPTTGIPKSAGGGAVGSVTAVVASGYNKWAIIAAVVAVVALVVIHFVKSRKPVYARLPAEAPKG